MNNNDSALLAFDEYDLLAFDDDNNNTLLLAIKNEDFARAMSILDDDKINFNKINVN